MYELELIVIHIINRDMQEQELLIPIRLIQNSTIMNDKKTVHHHPGYTLRTKLPVFISVFPIYFKKITYLCHALSAHRRDETGGKCFLFPLWSK